MPDADGISSERARYEAASEATVNSYSDTSYVMGTTNAASGTEQILNYSVHSSLNSFGVPYKTYLSNIVHDPTKVTYHWVIVGALVFDSHDRILLIQRTAKEFLPNLWEVPGGGCDEEDKSVIYSVVRELKEETGLKAINIGPAVGEGYHFPVSTGRIACKYSFVVEIAGQAGENEMVKVRLDPNEHQNHVWATEEEVRAGQVGNVELAFTSLAQEKVILEAFELRRKSKSGNSTADVAMRQPD